MADNVAITAGSGTNIAADDVSGVLYQRVKIAQGADGSATDVSSAAPLQVTGANGSFPVTDNSGSLTVDDGGSSITIDDGGSSITVDESAPTTIGSGRKTVTSAGTPLALGSSTTCKSVTVTALQSNTDIVVVGGTGVVAGSTNDGGSTRTGIPLFPNQSVTLPIANIATVFVDAVVSGEGVSYSYVN